tara:strand:- start:1614 stop:2033 length:420 start_codon:yes stop_codon:yes gene_type:complete
MDRGEIIMEKTLAIIKPDATHRNIIGDIISTIEDSKFKVIRLSSMILTESKAKEFYDIHSTKPFFDALIEYMTSGMIVAIELEKDNAVKEFRDLIGDTDPNNAKDGTIRKKFALNKSNNSIHGSDSNENAIKEIKIIFN